MECENFVDLWNLGEMPAELDLNSPQAFLAEVQLIVGEDGFKHTASEFRPFWESMLKTARAALQKQHVPEQKWHLRSRTARLTSHEEIETRVRLLAGRSLRLATALGAAGLSEEEESCKSRMARAAIAFCIKLKHSPSLLANAASAEITKLEAASERLTRID
jgi:hypothetical protein